MVSVAYYSELFGGGGLNLGAGGWNCGLVVIGAFDWKDPEAPASYALLRPLATACMLLWFSWVKASLINSLYVAHLELAMVFISLVPRPRLKLSIFFSSVSTKPRAYLDKLLNACIYSVRVFVP